MIASFYSLALLAALCVSLSMAVRRCERLGYGPSLAGMLYSAVVVLVAAYPGHPDIPAVWDGRTVPVALAALLAGPRAACITLGTAAVCAVWQDGASFTAGIVAILGAASAGVFGYYRWEDQEGVRYLLRVAALGAGLHGALAVLSLFLPGTANPDPEVYTRAFVLYPAVMAVAGAAHADQRRLAARAHLFHSVFDQQFQFMAILSPEGRLMQINDLPLRVGGVKREDVLGEYFWDTPWWKGLPEIRESWPRRLMEAAESDGPVLSVDEFQDSEGKVNIAEASITAVREATGELAYFIVQASDITARKEAEARLRERETLLRIAGHLARVGGWTVSLPDRQEKWSDEVFEILEWPKGSEPAVEDVLQLYGPASRARLSEALEACINEGTPFDLELQLVTKGGREIWIRGIGEALRDAAGRIVQIQGALQDITERVNAEIELGEVTNRLRGILEFSPLLIAVLDLDGRYLIANHAHDRLASRPMQGMTLQEVLPEQEAREYLREIRKVAERRQARTIEDRIEIGGEPRFLSTVLFPLLDASGAVTTVGGIAMDITDRRKAEAEREKLTEQLHQAQKMDAVGRLAGGVAHDFNNMLGVIVGYADMALAKLDGEDSIRSDLQEIQMAAVRSTDLIRQLLAFARRQTIAPKVLHLNYVVESMLKMLGRLIGENIDLLWKPGKDLCAVYIDPTQVDQILANLALNARDAVGKGGKLTIETEVAQFDEAYCAEHPGFLPGRYVVIAVSDDGCGMTPEVRDQAFEPFFTTKPPGEGTGLGLATVYGIVKQNRGFINVYSEPGQGTTFRIYLPASASRIGTEAAEPVAAGMPGGDETVLLVEDEPALLALGTRQLELLGYTVLPAATPGEALELAERHGDTIQLLMTDVIMPEMDGKELWRQIDAMRPGIKTLFVSGYTADTIAHRGVLDPEVHFLQKPFTARSVAAKIREVLEGRGAGEEG